MAKPCNEPLRVTTEDGFVLLEGGCGVAVTLTPIAAADTGGDLIDNAVQLIGDDRLRNVEVPKRS